MIERFWVCLKCGANYKIKVGERIDEEKKKKCMDCGGRLKLTKLGDKKKKITSKGLKEMYDKIIKVLKEYMDLEEKYYSLIALWIIGTYFHKKFPAYPYLYFNAMKGSGKTRILKIISGLSCNGKLSGSMTEAVMFRKASERTLCIDEFENMDSKEKGDLRLLLNSAYKKGIVVERARKSKEGGYDIEEFEVYCPIAIANIWGMSDVLSDRCVTIILEKSSKASVTKLIENFEENPDFIDIRENLQLMEIGDFKTLYKDWNDYQKNSVTSGSNGISGTTVTSGECDTCDTMTLQTLYKLVNLTNLQGRDLELFFPIYIVSHFLGKEVLSKTLKISKEIVKDRKELDMEENKDVQLLDFISTYEDTNFVSVTTLTNEFKTYVDSEDKWLNSTWMGRSLRRLNLVKDKRRTGKVRQVQLSIEKAQEKLKMFKEVDEGKEKENTPLSVVSSHCDEIEEFICADCGSKDAIITMKGKIYCKECAYKR